MSRISFLGMPTPTTADVGANKPNLRYRGANPTRERILQRRRDSEGGGELETETASTNSIEVTRNAKGDYQWSLKIYWRPDEDWRAVIQEQAEISN